MVGGRQTVDWSCGDGAGRRNQKDRHAGQNSWVPRRVTMWIQRLLCDKQIVFRDYQPSSRDFTFHV